MCRHDRSSTTGIRLGTGEMVRVSPGKGEAVSSQSLQTCSVPVSKRQGAFGGPRRGAYSSFAALGVVQASRAEDGRPGAADVRFTSYVPKCWSMRGA